MRATANFVLRAFLRIECANSVQLVFLATTATAAVLSQPVGQASKKLLVPLPALTVFVKLVMVLQRFLTASVNAKWSTTVDHVKRKLWHLHPKATGFAGLVKWESLFCQMVAVNLPRCVALASKKPCRHQPVGTGSVQLVTGSRSSQTTTLTANLSPNVAPATKSLFLQRLQLTACAPLARLGFLSVMILAAASQLLCVAQAQKRIRLQPLVGTGLASVVTLGRFRRILLCAVQHKAVACVSRSRSPRQLLLIGCVRLVGQV